MTKTRKISSFYIESLGCAKNTVDSHSMERILSTAGMLQAKDPADSDVIIVNTCGFINPAREESLSVLREYSNKKKNEQILVAAGCLSEREKKQLNNLVPGLDAALSTKRWGDILKVIRRLENKPTSPYFYFPETDVIMRGPEKLPRFAVQGASAYQKIADGCDRGCAFCAIPLIKGPMVSRTIENIIRDAKQLEQRGIQELILIAQDSTAYGRDLGLSDGLPYLLTTLLDQVSDIPWIRIMYTFPGSISQELIEVMRDSDRILPYLDIPLQHAHPHVLKRMQRPSNMKQVRKTISNMRKMMPDLSLRTTFIVGFPGESDQEFDELAQFTKEIEFDHVGIFPYYHESGTSAGSFKNDIPEEIKNERVEKLALIQEDISLKKNQLLIGKELQVLVEGNGDGISIGRSYRDAPEIDGLVFIQGLISPGKMVNTRITGAMIHDLIANTI